MRRAGGYPDVDLKLCDVTCRNNETLVVWNAVVAGLDPVTPFVLRGAFIDSRGRRDKPGEDRNRRCFHVMGTALIPPRAVRW